MTGKHPETTATRPATAVTRRTALGLVGVAGSIGLGETLLPRRAQGQPAALPLWAAALRAGIQFGASAAGELFHDAAYAGLHRTHSRLLVTDTAMKFDYLRPREDVVAFEAADALLAFARENGMALRGHTLFWNDYPPPWLKGKSAREIERIFEGHIELVGARYAGAMQSWDVVNEPFWPNSGAPGGFRRGPWFDAMGEAYIFRAFDRMAKIDRTAKLVLNEAFTEQNDALGKGVRARMIPLIDRMLDRGVKLDAVGLQAHLKPGIAFDLDAFLRFLDDIRARKLKIYLSEFDVDDDSFPADAGERDRLAAQWASRFLVPVLDNPGVEALITWHLSDRYSWYRVPAVAAQRRHGAGARPLPFDDAFGEKPMAVAIRQALLAARPR